MWMRSPELSIFKISRIEYVRLSIFKLTKTENNASMIPSLTLVNPKSRSKAFIYQAGATFQFRSDMCYILSCGSWFDFFCAFYYIPHLRFGNEFDIGMKAKMGM